MLNIIFFLRARNCAVDGHSWLGMLINDILINNTRSLDGFIDSLSDINISINLLFSFWLSPLISLMCWEQ